MSATKADAAENQKVAAADPERPTPTPETSEHFRKLAAASVAARRRKAIERRLREWGIVL